MGWVGRWVGAVCWQCRCWESSSPRAVALALSCLPLPDASRSHLAGMLIAIQTPMMSAQSYLENKERAGKLERRRRWQSAECAATERSLSPWRLDWEGGEVEAKPSPFPLHSLLLAISREIGRGFSDGLIIRSF